MALLTVQTVTDSGIEPAYTAVNASDTFPDDGTSRTFLEVVNGDGSPTTVAIAAVQASANVPGVGTITVPAVSVVVAAGDRAIIGPFTPAYRSSTGIITVTYSNTTSVTAGAFLLAKEA